MIVICIVCLEDPTLDVNKDCSGHSFVVAPPVGRMAGVVSPVSPGHRGDAELRPLHTDLGPRLLLRSPGDQRIGNT